MGRPFLVWTPEMDAALRSMHGRAPRDEIAAHIGVAEATVRNRRAVLGLPPLPRGRRKFNFTPEQDERLRRTWSDRAVTRVQLAREFGLGSASVIDRRAAQLGLPPRWDAIGTCRTRVRAAVAESPGITSDRLTELLGSAYSKGMVYHTLGRMEAAGELRRVRRRGRPVPPRGWADAASFYYPVASPAAADRLSGPTEESTDDRQRARELQTAGGDVAQAR